MSSLLPPNSTKLEKTLEKIIAKVDQLDVPFIRLNRIDLCPDKYLPWLAWEHRVEYWQPNWTIDKKRHAIKSAKDFNAGRGTKATLSALLDTVIENYKISAWHETTPKGQPYTFIVDVDEREILTIDQLSQAHTAVDATKSQRDLYSINANVLTTADIYLAGAGVSTSTVYLSTQG